MLALANLPHVLVRLGHTLLNAAPPKGPVLQWLSPLHMLWASHTASCLDVLLHLRAPSTSLSAFDPAAVY